MTAPDEIQKSRIPRVRVRFRRLPPCCPVGSRGERQCDRRRWFNREMPVQAGWYPWKPTNLLISSPLLILLDVSRTADAGGRGRTGRESGGWWRRGRPGSEKDRGARRKMGSRRAKEGLADDEGEMREETTESVAKKEEMKVCGKKRE